MIKLGLGVDDDEEEEHENAPDLLESVPAAEGDAADGSRMEEVD